MEIKLGHQIEDKITGFQGAVIGIVEYLTGCKQLLIQPRVKDGAWVESHWIDVDRADVIGVAIGGDLEIATKGGDKEAPKH